jgi:hypothetical protein
LLLFSNFFKLYCFNPFKISVIYTFLLPFRICTRPQYADIKLKILISEIYFFHFQDSGKTVFVKWCNSDPHICQQRFYNSQLWTFLKQQNIKISRIFLRLEILKIFENFSPSYSFCHSFVSIKVSIITSQIFHRFYFYSIISFITLRRFTIFQNFTFWSINKKYKNFKIAASTWSFYLLYFLLLFLLSYFKNASFDVILFWFYVFPKNK